MNDWLRIVTTSAVHVLFAAERKRHKLSTDCICNPRLVRNARREIVTMHRELSIAGREKARQERRAEGR